MTATLSTKAPLAAGQPAAGVGHGRIIVLGVGQIFWWLFPYIQEWIKNVSIGQ